MRPEELLQQQAAIARTQRSSLKVEQQELQQNRTQLSATLLSFDSALGAWRCRLEDGSVIYAKSITSSGGKGAGSVISLYKPAQGMAIIKWL